MSRRRLVLFFIAFLLIGFASIVSVITLNGNISFGFTETDFDVYFSKVLLNGEDKTDKYVVVPGKKISFLTSELTELGKKLVLDYTITNNSTIYDAEVKVKCAFDVDQDVATLESSLSNTVIPANTTKGGKLTVTLLKNLNDVGESEVVCELVAFPQEKDTFGTGDVPINTTQRTNALSGVLKDDDGNLIKNAVIVIESNEKIITTTDDMGSFYVGNLEGNSYDIKVVEENKLTEAVQKLSTIQLSEVSNIKGSIIGDTSETSLSNGYKLSISKLVNENYNLTGVLVDSSNNKLSNMVITLVDEGKFKYIVTTNNDGNFEINNISEGNFDIYIIESNQLKEVISKLDDNELEGLVSIKGKVSPKTETVELPNNKVIDKLKIIDNTLSGTLKDDKGEVQKNTTIVIYDEDNNQHTVETDDLGNFKVDNIRGITCEVYIVGETTEDLSQKVKEEIKDISISNKEIVADIKIELDNGVVSETTLE